jgi:hypothetical protein
MVKPLRLVFSFFFLFLKQKSAVATGLALLFFTLSPGAQSLNSGLVSSSVKLLSFTATLQSDNSIVLKWITGEEFNVKRFVVEKSYDGTLFKDHDIVFSSDADDELRNYQSVDNIAADAVPVIFYRLRIVDNEGGMRLSEIRSLRTATPAVMDLALKVYPNPLKEELRVAIPAAWLQKSIVFEILNVNGILMKRINSMAMSGMETLSLTNLNPAIYMLKATCQGQTIAQKIIKE